MSDSAGCSMRFARNALPLIGWTFKADLADMPVCVRCDSGLEETGMRCSSPARLSRWAWQTCSIVLAAAVV